MAVLDRIRPLFESADWFVALSAKPELLTRAREAEAALSRLFVEIDERFHAYGWDSTAPELAGLTDVPRKQIGLLQLITSRLGGIGAEPASLRSVLRELSLAVPDTAIAEESAAMRLRHGQPDQASSDLLNAKASSPRKRKNSDNKTRVAEALAAKKEKLKEADRRLRAEGWCWPSLANPTRLQDRIGGAIDRCLVVIHGPALGKKYLLPDREFTIGRDVHNDMVMDLTSVSNRQARIVTRESKSYLSAVDSTKGTFLNDKKVVSERRLRTGDTLQVGEVMLKFLHSKSIETLFHEEIYRLAIVDGLTQLHNKRYALEFLGREMGRSHRHSRPLSVVVFGIDDLTKITDTHGQVGADFVLRQWARVTKRMISKDQCLARYGPEEFVLVMPEVNPDDVHRFAEDVRIVTRDYTFRFDKKKIPVTVSMGAFDLTPNVTDPEQFIEAAQFLKAASTRDVR